jgi:uncharacterized protein (DUF1810 family)
MNSLADLERFVKAQEGEYQTALQEVRNGRKQSHWIWYIFPQIQGLGYSSTAQYYAIRNLPEAEAYLRHPVLGRRLKEITRVLLDLKQKDPERIFGYPDVLKVRSCMTLFHEADSQEPLFQEVLDQYYEGQEDRRTIEILQKQKDSR